MIRKAACAALIALAAGPLGAETSPPLPDPTHVGITLPADIKWTGAVGEQRAYLYGDPDKPGPYMVMYKWGPGHHSKPHSHAADRTGYVVSGTWWMSSSAKEDTSTLYPVRAGSFVLHKANEIHWDGGVDNTAIVIVTGIGPISTKRVASN